MPSLSLLVTIALALVIVATAAGLTARSRTARPLVRGAGFAAIPVGYYLIGFMDLTINGIGSLIAWLQRTAFTNVTAWGIGLLAGGIVVAVLGGFLRKEPRPPKEAKAPKGSGKKQAGPATSAKSVSAQPPAGQATAPTSTQPAKPTPNQAKPAPQKGLDPEDAEIEAMLRKRGIM